MTCEICDYFRATEVIHYETEIVALEFVVACQQCHDKIVCDEIESLPIIETYPIAD